MEHYYYLFLDALTLSFPLLRSFESKINYSKKWFALFPSIIIVALIFIVWDVIFTINGVWGFNPRYLVGFELFHLPIEEWLFFIVVPFSCVFIYECVKYFRKPILWPNYGKIIAAVLGTFLIVLGIFNYSKNYTFITFLSLGLFLLIHILLFKSNYLGTFFFSYLFVLLPFLLVNGILTGSFIEEQIVWYNNEENLGIRIFTIPIEDVFYGMLLILLNITLYEYILKKTV